MPEALTNERTMIAPSRRRVEGWFASTRTVVSILLISTGCDRSTSPTLVPFSNAPSVNITPLEERVVSFCGDCHGYPTADLFPKSNWDSEVKRGFDFYNKADRNLDPPPFQDVVDYYKASAPDQLPLIPPTPDGPTPLREFKRSEIAGPVRATQRPFHMCRLSTLRIRKAPTFSDARWHAANS